MMLNHCKNAGGKNNEQRSAYRWRARTFTGVLLLFYLLCLCVETRPGVAHYLIPRKVKWRFPAASTRLSVCNHRTRRGAREQAGRERESERPAFTSHHAAEFDASPRDRHAAIRVVPADGGRTNHNRWVGGWMTARKRDNQQHSRLYKYLNYFVQYADRIVYSSYWLIDSVPRSIVQCIYLPSICFQGRVVLYIYCCCTPQGRFLSNSKAHV